MRAKARGSCPQASELPKIELHRYVACAHSYTLLPFLPGCCIIVGHAYRHQSKLTHPQRAFRQRKEGYIKKLEEQVKDFQTMEQNFRALQNENYQLREYILNLQSRLLENQSEFPPAPSHINLPSGSHPGSSAGAEPNAVEQQLRREMQSSDSMRHDGMSQLQAAAAQASEARPQESPYGLGSEHASKRARTEDGAPGDVKPSS